MLRFCNRAAARVIAGMSNTMIAMNTRSILLVLALLIAALALGVFAVPVAQAQSPPFQPSIVTVAIGNAARYQQGNWAEHPQGVSMKVELEAVAR